MNALHKLSVLVGVVASIASVACSATSGDDGADGSSSAYSKPLLHACENTTYDAELSPGMVGKYKLQEGNGPLQSIEFHDNHWANDYSWSGKFTRTLTDGTTASGTFVAAEVKVPDSYRVDHAEITLHLDSGETEAYRMLFTRVDQISTNICGMTLEVEGSTETFRMILEM